MAHAPITEALIDIHVAPYDGQTFDRLKEAIGSPEFGYYVKGPISESRFGFMMTPDGGQPQTTAQSEQIGLRLHSSDEKYVAQFRIPAFTLSRLPPYENWETLVEEARRLWAIYVEKLTPTRITRIATRFINNLQLPLEQGTSYQVYLHKLVDVPDEAPQAVASFFQRFELIDTETAAHMNLTAALEASPPDGPVPVILDIDAFMTADLNPTDARLWEILDRLRGLKNRTFFGTITEQAAELYQ